MPPFRFIHTADLHVDSPFRGLSEVAPTLQPILREATFQAFDGIIDLCISRDVNFLLIAGDIHDAVDRSLRALTRLKQAFERLAEHQIHVFVCHGNHDPLSGWGARFSWPSNVSVFGSTDIEAKPVLQRGTEIARVYGMSYATEKVEDNLAQKFQKEGHAPWSIGLLHANVGSDPNHLNYAPCNVEDLVQSKMNYWALGHVHAHRVLRHRDPLIVYPGNPQGRHIREAGPRGCYLVEVDASGHAQYEFIPVDVVRWHNQSIDVDGLRDFDELLTRIEEQVQQLRRMNDGRGMVVRWQLEGRGSLHRELARPGRMEDLLATLRDKWGVGPNFVWSQAILDRTGREVDIDMLRQEENILGDFLRLANARGEEQEQELREVISTLFDDPRIYRYLDRPSDDQLWEWVQTAEGLGIDRLLTSEE